MPVQKLSFSPGKKSQGSTEMQIRRPVWCFYISKNKDVKKNFARRFLGQVPTEELKDYVKDPLVLDNLKPTVSIWGLAAGEKNNKTFENMKSGTLLVFSHHTGAVYTGLFYHNFVLDKKQTAFSQKYWQGKRFEYNFIVTDVQSHKVTDCASFNRSIGLEAAPKGNKLLDQKRLDKFYQLYNEWEESYGYGPYTPIEESKLDIRTLLPKYNDQDGHLYLLYDFTDRDHGLDVYKVGKTKQCNYQDRTKQGYPSKSLEIKVDFCPDIDQVETDILQLFENEFGPPYRGKEYFQGDLNKMKSIINDYITEHPLTNVDGNLISKD